MADEEELIRALGSFGPSTLEELAEYLDEDPEDIEFDLEECIESGLVERGTFFSGWRHSLTRAGEKFYALLPDEKYTVFVVHGHNHVVVRELESFLRNEFDEQLEVVVLMDKPDRGMESLYDKFRRHAEEVDIAILVATGDDVASSKSDPKRTVQQPRPNVIWEAGRFSERLGDERVFLLRAPGVTMPGNIDGAMWTPLSGDWRHILGRNLRYLLREI